MSGKWTSIFSNVITDADGNIKRPNSYRPNLRTNSGADWQGAAMLGGTNKGESGAATSTTATSLTKTGATFPTSGDGPATANNMGGYQGKIVYAGPNSSGTGSTVYGVIITNTATVLTVDMWQAAGSPGTAGTTPNATANFQIGIGAAPTIYLGLTATSITPAATDTTLSGELSSGGFSRALYDTYSHSNGATSGFIQKTFTASATQTINGEAVFNAQNGGVMTFESTEPNPPTLVSGDTLQQKVTLNY